MVEVVQTRLGVGPGTVRPRIMRNESVRSSLEVVGSNCRLPNLRENVRAGSMMLVHAVNSSSFLPSRLSPSCRLRTKNNSRSASSRKAQAKKNIRDRQPLDGDSHSADDVREFQAGKSSSASPDVNLPRGAEGNGAGTATAQIESLLSPDQVNQAPESEALVGRADTKIEISQPVKEKEDMKTSKVSLPNRGSSNEEGGPSGVSVNDLMLMIKEAEKNIILLNQVRARALEELENVRSVKDDLQGQVHVLSARLAEADAKAKLGDQAKEKNKFLEGELNSLQARLDEKEHEAKAALQLKAEYVTLQQQAQNLAARLEASSAAGSEVKVLKSQIEAYEEEVKNLRKCVADLNVKEEVVQQLEGEKQTIQEYAHCLELKLAEVEENEIENARLKAREAALQAELVRLKAELEETSDGSVVTPQLVTETDLLRKQLQALQESMKSAEEDQLALNMVQAENAALREQVQILQQRILESDTEIRQQLELYQDEVEAFQSSLEGLKADSGLGIAQVPVGEMPWDFWSNLLLRIDALMLGKQLSLDDGLELRIMAWRREARIRDAYVAVQNEKDADVAAGLTELTKLKKKPGYHVVHIAAEMAPVAKVGGLGDVVTGLGRALQKKGHLVEIILPKYDCMDYSRIKNLKVLDVELYSYFDGQTHKNKIWLGIVEGLPVYFIEPHHPAKFFWRGQFYGENDDFKRFTYFCRAALEFLLQSGKKPDMIHTHDWQTAAVAPLYWDIYVSQGLDSARLAFTCHNFEYQGVDAPGALASCGLNVQQLHRPDRMQDNFAHDRVNLLKGGIVFSNVVTTVSPTYAQEVRAPEGGRGLHLTLAQHSKKFLGVLNGIDNESWNPATDPLLEFQFSADDLNGKYANKAALRTRLGLAPSEGDDDRPLVGCITRLVPQKGVHLIRHAIYRTLECGGQFILLGSSPVPSIQREFEGIARDFDQHPHIRLVLKYDEALSHSIYAASDMFVIPSIFEPCGLTQMIAMRYGSIPVVRKTGGLNDSVFDADDSSYPEEKKNGFTFSAANEGGLNFALDRAMAYYKTNRQWWQKLVTRAMKMDYSWDHSADEYIDLYRQCLERATTKL
ncbi:hypothetical protein Mapa_003871 [Marchantia paleacea]|nr:hypothetical protein Mapa_003871 [Marchantia paleacea]